MSNSDQVILVRDLILLGRAVPERRRDGRITICAAGYSHEHGFVRVYPTRSDTAWHQWDIISVQVTRNSQDSRSESWRVAKRDWSRTNESITKVGTLPDSERWPLLQDIASPCVLDINARQASLGVVMPDRDTLRGYWTSNDTHDDPFQLGLELLDEPVVNLKRDYPHEPRVSFRCTDCLAKRKHDMQVLDWSFYQWQRKEPARIDQVWENAQFFSDAHDIFFLVGNQQNQRTSYMVISVLREHRPAALRRRLF